MRPELQRRVQRYGWDKAASFYESSWKEQLKPAQDMVLKMANLQSGESVLETSCGTGLVSFRIANAVGPDGHVDASDISQEMVDIATREAKKHNLNNIRFQRLDAEDLELDSESYNVAICSLGIMYMPDPAKALQEMHRVLKPGGRTVIAIWGERKQCGWADIFPIVDKRVASDVCPLFFQQGTGNTIVHTLEAAGYQHIEVERFRTSLHYSSPKEALVAAFSGGPVALAYNKFDDKTREEAHKEYLDSIAPYRNATGFNIPGEFVVARGKKA